MKFYWWILLLPLLLACSGSQPTIFGKIANHESEEMASQIYLIDPLNFEGIASSFLGQIIDSATIQPSGVFQFNDLPKVEKPEIWELAVQAKGEQFKTRLNNDDQLNANYFPVIWNNQTLEIQTNMDSFQNSFQILKPNAENLALMTLRDLKQRAYAQYVVPYNDDLSLEEILLDKEHDFLNYQRVLMDFADQSEFLLPAIVATRWVSIENNYERIPEFIFGQCQQWTQRFPDHPLVQSLCEFGNPDKLPLMINDRIPNYFLPMMTGDTSSILDLLGEKLTILDLWASWCMPCRQENKKVLVPLWDQYHRQGLQIIGYSIDAGQKAWIKGIESDGADRWRNASHLQGDDSPFFEELRILTIPANFILDRNGKVLAKNLHDQDLIEFVHHFLENN